MRRIRYIIKAKMEDSRSYKKSKQRNAKKKKKVKKVKVTEKQIEKKMK